MTEAILIVLGYLCGSIPFGLLAGRLKGVDIRAHGSGNIGATNVGRVLGREWGLLVFALDVLKGFLPTLLAGRMVARPGAELAGGLLIWAAVGAACIFGHLFPIFLGFRGGKGVATSLGALLGIYPYFTWPACVALGLWIVLTAATRYVSVGSVAAAVAFPLTFGIFVMARRATWPAAADLWPLFAFSIVVAALVVYRHRGNLKRLMAGTEPRIGAAGGGSVPPARSSQPAAGDSPPPCAMAEHPNP